VIASLILLFSLGALAQFLIAYCRTLIATYGRAELSLQMREAIGFDGQATDPGEFDRLMGLIRIAPSPGDDHTEIRVITLYYRLIALAGALLSPVSAKASQWFECERARCSYFAAVTLDRRLVALQK
jgi:hypothetical protein